MNEKPSGPIPADEIREVQVFVHELPTRELDGFQVVDATAYGASGMEGAATIRLLGPSPQDQSVAFDTTFTANGHEWRVDCWDRPDPDLNHQSPVLRVRRLG